MINDVNGLIANFAVSQPTGSGRPIGDFRLLNLIALFQPFSLKVVECGWSRRAQECFPSGLPDDYFDDAALDSRLKDCGPSAAFVCPGVLKCFFISEVSDAALSFLKAGSEKIACKSVTIRIRFTVGIATVTTGRGYSSSSSSITPSVNFVT